MIAIEVVADVEVRGKRIPTQEAFPRRKRSVISHSR